MHALQQIYSGLEARIENFTTRPAWKVKYALALSVLAICFATPAYRSIPGRFKFDYWQRVKHQIQQPFTPFQLEGMGTHAEKKSFRLTVPLIARGLHLNQYGIFALQNLLGICFLYFLLKMTETITGDRHCTFWLGLGFATIYVGRACFIDIYSWFDGWAYLFLLLAMLFRNHASIFVCSSLAAWTDERAALALSMVFFWWWLLLRQKDTTASWRTSRCFMVVLAFGGYLLGRHILQVKYGLSTPMQEAGMSIFYRQMDFLGVGAWTFLEGLWLIVLTAIVSLWQQKKYLLGTIILAFMAVFSAGALMVHDVTRSGTYLFPLFFICLYIIKHHEAAASPLRKLTMVSAAVCVVFPAIFVITAWDPPTFWQKPFIAGAVKHLILSVGK